MYRKKTYHFKRKVEKEKYDNQITVHTVTDEWYRCLRSGYKLYNKPEKRIKVIFK